MTGQLTRGVPVAADLPRGTEVRWDQPTAPRTRTHAPRPADTSAHATWRTRAQANPRPLPSNRCDTVRRVLRPEATRRSRRRSRDRSPLTTCAHPERTQPLTPLGEPHRVHRRWLRSSRRRAQTLRNRSSATSNTRPWETTSGSNRRPAQPVVVSPTAADTAGSSAPRSRVNGVSTRSPRPGSE